jgi:hypothetical protein
MVRCGLGYMRVITDYVGDGTGDLEIQVKQIEDPLSVYFDPSSSEPDGSDADWCAIVTYLSKEAYKAEFPTSKLADAETGVWAIMGEEIPGWADQHGCRVVEYYERTRTEVRTTIDGDRIDGDDTPVNERKAYEYKVKWYKVNGIEELDSTDWPGMHIPVIPVYGNKLVSKGKRIYSGLIRTAKGPCLAYDYNNTTQAELIGQSPKAPWIAVEGTLVNPEAWKNANSRPVSVLTYQGYDGRGNQVSPPQRTFGEPAIQAVTMAKQGAIEDIKAVTGMYDPVRGINEGGQSGVAIRRLQAQGQMGNFHYADNLARSIRQLGRVMIAVAKAVIDTPRWIQIVRPDETNDMVRLNEQYEDKDGAVHLYDFRKGRFDVTVSAGPGYQTKRQENLAMLESILQGPMGQLMALAAPDLVASMLDFGISKELQDRFKAMLPPPVLAAMEKAKGAQGGRQNQPDPQAMAQMQQMGQQMQQMDQIIQQMSQELQQSQADLASKQADNQIKMAEVQIKMQDSQAKTADMQTRAELETMKLSLEAEKLDLERRKLDLESVRLKLDARNEAIAAMSAGKQPEEDERGEIEEPEGFEGALQMPTPPPVPVTLEDVAMLLAEQNENIREHILSIISNPPPAINPGIVRNLDGIQQVAE